MSNPSSFDICLNIILDPTWKVEIENDKNFPVTFKKGKDSLKFYLGRTILFNYIDVYRFHLGERDLLIEMAVSRKEAERKELKRKYRESMSKKFFGLYD